MKAKMEERNKLEYSIEILTKLKIEAHDNKEIYKERLISFCIKLLKVIERDGEL